MMEPAAYGASVMFGPHTPTFARPSSSLLERNAARQVADADELTLRTARRSRRSRSRGRRGAAGRTFVLAQNGAAGRTLAELDRLVESSFAKQSLEHWLAFSTGTRRMK